MKTTMDLNVSVRCPVDGEAVQLAVTVETGKEVLKVEELLSIIGEMNRLPILQETFTRVLAHRLELPVKTVGIHSGVTITCQA